MISLMRSTITLILVAGFSDTSIKISVTVEWWLVIKRCIAWGRITSRCVRISPFCPYCPMLLIQKQVVHCNLGLCIVSTYSSFARKNKDIHSDVLVFLFDDGIRTMKCNTPVECCLFPARRGQHLNFSSPPEKKNANESHYPPPAADTFQTLGESLQTGWHPIWGVIRFAPS